MPSSLPGDAGRVNDVAGFQDRRALGCETDVGTHSHTPSRLTWPAVDDYVPIQRIFSVGGTLDEGFHCGNVNSLRNRLRRTADPRWFIHSFEAVSPRRIRPDRHTHLRCRSDSGTRRDHPPQGRSGHRDRPRHQTLRRLRRRGRGRLLHRVGRVLLDARPVRLRQDDDAADDRRVRDAHRGCDPARRRRRLARPAAQAQRQHGVPALRAVPAHDGVGQRRLRTPQQEEGQGRGPQARRRAAGDRAADRLRRAQARPALRRPAAAGRPGPGAGELPQRTAARRTARRAGPQAAPGDAVRAQAHPARGRDHVHLRDPRPRRGADDERPDRGDERRQRRPDRHPDRDL